ncbi:MAG TPA: hypothetical protein VN739_02705 [Nitrososphaerales archaeon]|nr:hypothetical protein [Nitrososphaerales archaeon]
MNESQIVFPESRGLAKSCKFYFARLNRIFGDERMKLDVCIATRIEKMPNLEAMLIDSGVPYDQIFIDSSETLLAKKRENLIKRVGTNNFIFLDDDVFLPKGWYENIMKFWDEKLAWLEGYANPSKPEWYAKWCEYRLGTVTPYYIAKGERGFLCSTIIKTDYVSDFLAPPSMSYAEDWALSKHVQSKGGKMYRVPVRSYHNFTYNLFDHTRTSTKMMRKYVPWTTQLKQAAVSVASGLKCAVATSDFEVAAGAIHLSYEMIAGTLF